MSPVGHSLVGLAFAVLAYPKKSDLKWQIGLPICFVVLASLPDWPIPNWGHDRYDISHSIFVNAMLVGMVLAFYYLTPKVRSTIPARLVWLGAGAWFSHLLLDSFYSHGRGVAIYWPFSDGRLKLSLPWFNTLDPSESIISTHNLSVYVIEFIAYLPVLLVAIGISKMIHRKPIATPQENAG